MHTMPVGGGMAMCSAISARLKNNHIHEEYIKRAYCAAKVNGTSFCEEILHQPEVDEEVVCSGWP